MNEIAVVLVFAVLGCVSIIIGVQQLSVPLAWVTFGVFCLFAAAWPFLRGNLTRGTPDA